MSAIAREMKAIQSLSIIPNCGGCDEGSICFEVISKNGTKYRGAAGNEDGAYRVQGSKLIKIYDEDYNEVYEYFVCEALHAWIDHSIDALAKHLGEVLAEQDKQDAENAARNHSFD
ncbi:hypothetical protein [Xanthomonas sp. MUS 060]|uniref:hypothetical protein n=1 Tax=Xanthomonas sp. MUS 060 TaxID=1588031 RepID=UPI0005F27C3F|nr:hypothetical protein [Xanthomonas sp. MUS 060]